MINIYWDLDGLLADFNTYWGDDKTFDKERFKKEVLENNMFNKLEVLEKSRKLLIDISNYCMKNSVEYNFQVLGSLGSPNDDELANKIIQQKTDWIAKHFTNVFSNLNFVKRKGLKKLYATNNSLLIDDTADNVNDFIENNGKAYLWNDNISYEMQLCDILLIIKSMTK